MCIHLRCDLPNKFELNKREQNYAQPYNNITTIPPPPVGPAPLGRWCPVYGAAWAPARGSPATSSAGPRSAAPRCRTSAQAGCTSSPWWSGLPASRLRRWWRSWCAGGWTGRCRWDCCRHHLTRHEVCDMPITNHLTRHEVCDMPITSTFNLSVRFWNYPSMLSMLKSDN